MPRALARLAAERARPPAQALPKPVAKPGKLPQAGSASHFGAGSKESNRSAQTKATSDFKPERLYEELKPLGAGAFGAAVLVRRRLDGLRFVAKKCCIKELNEKQRLMCLEELSLLRKVKHECIAEVVDFQWAASDKLTYWIVLKHYSRGDVQGEIDDCRQNDLELPMERVKSWTSQLCMALDHVHKMQIVHRDVKGSNMFITGAGNVVLGDFGVSKQLRNGATRAMTNVGSPVFMAPECWDGQGGTGKSDMWSVGVVLYELVALRRPFEAGNVLSLVNKVTNEDPPPLPDDCDDDVKSLVFRLLMKDQLQRPSASEALESACLKRCVEIVQIYRLALERLNDKRANELALAEDIAAGKLVPGQRPHKQIVKDLGAPGAVNLVARARAMASCSAAWTAPLEDEDEMMEGEEDEDDEDADDVSDLEQDDDEDSEVEEGSDDDVAIKVRDARENEEDEEGVGEKEEKGLEEQEEEEEEEEQDVDEGSRSTISAKACKCDEKLLELSLSMDSCFHGGKTIFECQHLGHFSASSLAASTTTMVNSLHTFPPEATCAAPSEVMGSAKKKSVESNACCEGSAGFRVEEITRLNIENTSSQAGITPKSVLPGFGSGAFSNEAAMSVAGNTKQTIEYLELNEITRFDNATFSPHPVKTSTSVALLASEASMLGAEAASSEQRADAPQIKESTLFDNANFSPAPSKASKSVVPVGCWGSSSFANEVTMLDAEAFCSEHTAAVTEVTEITLLDNPNFSPAPRKTSKSVVPMAGWGSTALADEATMLHVGVGTSENTANGPEVNEITSFASDIFSPVTLRVCETSVLQAIACRSAASSACPQSPVVVDEVIASDDFGHDIKNTEVEHHEVTMLIGQVTASYPNPPNATESALRSITTSVNQESTRFAVDVTIVDSDTSNIDGLTLLHDMVAPHLNVLIAEQTALCPKPKCFGNGMVTGIESTALGVESTAFEVLESRIEETTFAYSVASRESHDDYDVRDQQADVEFDSQSNTEAHHGRNCAVAGLQAGARGQATMERFQCDDAEGCAVGSRTKSPFNGLSASKREGQTAVFCKIAEVGEEDLEELSIGSDDWGGGVILSTPTLGDRSWVAMDPSTVQIEAAMLQKALRGRLDSSSPQQTITRVITEATTVETTDDEDDADDNDEEDAGEGEEAEEEEDEDEELDVEEQVDADDATCDNAVDEKSAEWADTQECTVATVKIDMDAPGEWARKAAETQAYYSRLVAELESPAPTARRHIEDTHDNSSRDPMCFGLKARGAPSGSAEPWRCKFQASGLSRASKWSLSRGEGKGEPKFDGNEASARVMTTVKALARATHALGFGDLGDITLDEKSRANSALGVTRLGQKSSKGTSVGQVSFYNDRDSWRPASFCVLPKAAPVSRRNCMQHLES